MNKILAKLALVVALFTAGAKADTVLLNLLNPPTQSDTPYDLSFIASGPMTEISFAGYQLLSAEIATDISVTSIGGPTLLGQTWGLIPAADGSIAFEYDDGYGTGTNALAFEGVVTGDYDTFYQTFSTAVGQSYDVKFLFSQGDPSSPSAFVVTTASVPEASSGVFLLTMLLGVAFVARANCDGRVSDCLKRNENPTTVSQ